MKYSKEEQRKLYQLSKSLLNNETGVDELEALRQVIEFHEWKYYIDNDPVVSDYEYDRLFQKLKDIEQENPELISSSSPTQRVSTDLVESFNSVNHITPMLSLENSYNSGDLVDFDKQIRKLCTIEESDSIKYSVEPKMDGGSIALVFENDLLIRAATRGNGIQGEEITLNAKALPSIPLKAAFSKYGIYRAELRGEAVIQKNTFLKLNEKREEEGLNIFANPRNAATGGLRMKNPQDTRNRGIEVFLFQLSHASNVAGDNLLTTFNSHFQQLEMLSELGFKIPQKAKKRFPGIEDVIKFTTDIEMHREDFPYEIDGMVIKVDAIDLQLLCGSTSHHPRWAVAYKFKAKQATTKLLNVEYQVGKIGSITPVAKLKAVQLAGVTVSSVSLHNEEFVVSKDLHIGDAVLVERAGDVIPYIVKAFPELRDGSEIPIRFPEFCPINYTEQPVKLIRIEGEAAWRCPDCICGAQDLQRIIFHVSKPAMDIDGFGKSYVERFYELGWLKDISDIYQLDYEAISQLEGFGQKSAENLKKAIENARGNSLSRILHSLSIHHLGKKASKLLAANIEHIFDLKDWDLEKFTSIKDIGPVVAHNVREFFCNDKNIAMLERMEARGVDLSQKEEDKPFITQAGLPLSGKTILFTGSLQQMGRKEAQILAEQAGAKILSAVSKNLDILVVGEKAGSKLKKAQTLGTVEIITEAAFHEIMKTL